MNYFEVDRMYDWNSRLTQDPKNGVAVLYLNNFSYFPWGVGGETEFKKYWTRETTYDTLIWYKRGYFFWKLNNRISMNKGSIPGGKFRLILRP